MVNLHCSETKQSNIRTQAKLLSVLQGSKTATRSMIVQHFKQKKTQELKSVREEMANENPLYQKTMLAM